MTALRKPASMLAPEQRLITIASGKGGVGKTWLSVSLAHALAAQGKSVLLFDGDLGLANVDIQLGITPQRDISAVVLGKAAIKDVITPVRIGSAQFDMAAGCSGTGTLAQLSREALLKLKSQLVIAAKDYDHLLLDLGAGIDQSVTTLSDHAGHCLVVMTAEPTSLTDAYAFIKLRQLRGDTGTVSVVVNNASRQEAKTAYETLVRACKHFLGFAPELAGIVRRDSHVPESIRAQMPIAARFADSPAALDILALAKSLG
jgi:flagellar biosynthesis protein FlhG